MKNQQNGLIFAALSTNIGLLDGGALPDSIQWMPPGTHSINASQAGKPVTKKVRVTPNTAVTMNTFLQAKLALVAKGEEDRPFFDFNHDDREASAWPTEFYWGGDDPVTGGVRAKVEWSASGKAAIEGKDFRRFSPTFICATDGTVTGSEINMGGLVNRAAFKRIQAIWGKDENEQEGTKMNKLMKVLVDLGLITAAAQDDEETAISQVRAKVVEFKAQGDELITAKQTIKTQTEAVGVAIEAKADAAIEAAVKARRIAPKDEDTKAFYKASLVADYDKTIKIVEKLPVIAKDPTETVVEPGADEGEVSSRAIIAKQEAAILSVRAKNPGMSPDEVFQTAEAENPELFKC